jgi:hypothetical protein
MLRSQSQGQVHFHHFLGRGLFTQSLKLHPINEFKRRKPNLFIPGMRSKGLNYLVSWERKSLNPNADLSFSAIDFILLGDPDWNSWEDERASHPQVGWDDIRGVALHVGKRDHCSPLPPNGSFCKIQISLAQLTVIYRSTLMFLLLTSATFLPDPKFLYAKISTFTGKSICSICP